MDSDSIHNLAIVRGGLTVLAKESGSLRPGALLRELEKLRDLFKGIDIAEENAESARSSAATQVFNTYELTEMILQQLPLQDLVKAQQVCRMSRNVCRDSKRIGHGFSVYSVDVNLRCNAPFKKLIDFDLTRRLGLRNTLHLLGGQPVGPTANWLPHEWYAEPPDRAYVSFVLGHESKRTWHTRGFSRSDRFEASSTIYDRTIIAPATPTPNANDAERELWRSVAWTQDDCEVKVHLRRECSEGHPLDDIRVFTHGVTLGEIFDWMWSMITARPLWTKVKCPTGDLLDGHRTETQTNGTTVTYGPKEW